MIATRKSISRRTVLRGAGATLALPFLDAMVPALSARAATAKPATRVGFFYVPNGIQITAMNPPGDVVVPTPILKPLEKMLDRVVVVSGLTNLQADHLDVSTGAHSRAQVTWLSGMRAKRTEGADVRCGTTLDQYAARVLGKETPLDSLQVALEPNYLVGNCEGGYSCVYQNTFSWRTPTQPVPMETNPRVVFERLFGSEATAEERVVRMRKDRGILDAVADDMARLTRSLVPADRRMVNEYVDSVRDVEKRLEKLERHAQASVDPVGARPDGIPGSFEEHARLMFDLQFLAYQADITRVIAFQISREASARAYPNIGIEDSHHEISHHGGNAEKIAKHTKINTYHMSLFAEFVGRMAAAADGDGSLLDHALLVYGSGLGDGHLHSPHNLPVVLVGSGSGTVRGGRHIKAKIDTPMMNFGLSLLDKVNVELESVGDSTGRLADL
jgi:hypothetical protein